MWQGRDLGWTEAPGREAQSAPQGPDQRVPYPFWPYRPRVPDDPKGPCTWICPPHIPCDAPGHLWHQTPTGPLGEGEPPALSLNSSTPPLTHLGPLVRLVFFPCSSLPGPPHPLPLPVPQRGAPRTVQHIGDPALAPGNQPPCAQGPGAAHLGRTRALPHLSPPLCGWPCLPLSYHGWGGG